MHNLSAVLSPASEVPHARVPKNLRGHMRHRQIAQPPQCLVGVPSADTSYGCSPSGPAGLARFRLVHHLLDGIGRHAHLCFVRGPTGEAFQQESERHQFLFIPLRQ